MLVVTNVTHSRAARKQIGFSGRIGPKMNHKSPDILTNSPESAEGPDVAEFDHLSSVGLLLSVGAGTDATLLERAVP
jgi:hypothetical protein